MILVHEIKRQIVGFSKNFCFDADIDKFISGAKAVFDSDGGDAEEYFMLRLRLKKGV